MVINGLYFGFTATSAFFLHNISVAFMPGKLHAIFGKNGMGKSTFFRVLQGQLASSEQVQGKIMLGDQELDMANREHRALLQQRIVYIEQDYNKLMIPGYTGLDLLKLSMLRRFPLFTRLISSPYEYLAYEFDLPLQVPVEQLSGGQSQILALLLQLKSSMQVLLLDEPTAALDHERSEQLMRLLRTLMSKYNITVLMISHDTDYALRHADACYELVSTPTGARQIQAFTKLHNSIELNNPTHGLQP